MRNSLFAFLFVLALAGCTSTYRIGPDFCAVYKPVPTLHAGTETQQLLVDENNATYYEHCLSLKEKLMK